MGGFSSQGWDRVGIGWSPMSSAECLRDSVLPFVKRALWAGMHYPLHDLLKKAVGKQAFAVNAPQIGNPDRQQATALNLFKNFEGGSQLLLWGYHMVRLVRSFLLRVIISLWRRVIISLSCYPGHR